MARKLADEVLDVPVRPLNVTFPKPVKKTTKGKPLVALLYGDSHHPYQCERTLAVVGSILTDLQPDVVIDVGDGVDAAHLSDKFRTDPRRTTTLQQEINSKRIQLAQYRMAAPNADFYYEEGNHCERMRRAVWNSEGPMRALMQLDIVANNLTWPKLLGLDELRMKFVPYDEQPLTGVLPKFIVKHGSVVRGNSGYSATGEMTKYNRSGASGHTHRLGAVWRRDLNGQHLWLETGTCCDLDNPPPGGGKDTNWQNGCVVLTFDQETGAVQPEPIDIRARGITYWRGTKYRA